MPVQIPGDVQGKGIQGRLTDRWLRELTTPQQNLARWIVRQLHRTEDDRISAKGRVEYRGRHYEMVIAKRGNGYVDIVVDGQRRWFGSAKSTSDALCAAINSRTDIFRVATQEPERDTQNDDGTEGEVPDTDSGETGQTVPEPEPRSPESPRESPREELLRRCHALRDYLNRSENAVE